MVRAVVIDENDTVTNVAQAKDQAFIEAQGWIASDTAQMGDVWDGTQFTTPGPTVAERKASMQAQAKSQYRRTLSSGFTFDGATFSIADPARRQRLLEIVSQVNAFRNGDATNALPNGKSTVQFFDNSGTAHDFGPVQVVQFGETGNGFVQDADERIAQIMGQIEAAQSHGNLDNINVTTGWPT